MFDVAKGKRIRYYTGMSFLELILYIKYCTKRERKGVPIILLSRGPDKINPALDISI